MILFNTFSYNFININSFGGFLRIGLTWKINMLLIFFFNLLFITLFHYGTLVVTLVSTILIIIIILFILWTFFIHTEFFLPYSSRWLFFLFCIGLYFNCIMIHVQAYFNAPSMLEIYIIFICKFDGRRQFLIKFNDKWLKNFPFPKPKFLTENELLVACDIFA